MAAGARTREKVDTLPLRKVALLVRENLLYNGENWQTPKSIGRIACALGTTVDSVQRLAEVGHFSGAVPELAGQFYTIPNYKYKDLRKSPLGQEVVNQILDKEVDVIQSAIEYAEGDNVSVYRRGEDPTPPSTPHEGVVIAFKGSALGAEASIYDDEIHDSFELVLPEVPTIKMIEGIYPVDVAADQALTQSLRELATRAR